MSKARPAADCVAGYFGARGSGKNYGVEQDMGASPARLLAIDPMDQFAHRAERVGSLVELVKRSDAGRFALRYVPPDIADCTDVELARRFDVFCRLAWRRAPLTLIIDEGHLFTSPSSAPKAWRACTLLGRHRGIAIRLISQRPAHVDKHFFTNATYLRTGRLNFEDDVVTMARALGVPRDAVAGLIGHQWISRDMLTGALHADDGRLGFVAGAPLWQARRNAKKPRPGAARRRRSP